VNKPVNLHYFYLSIHIFFYFFYFFLIFFVFGAGPSSAHMGWAGPSQPSPVTRPSKWPGWDCAKWKLNKLAPEEKIAYHSAARFVSFFPLCSCDSANGWFPCFWYLIDLLCSLRFSFVVFGCRSYEGTLPSLSSVSTRPCLPLGFLLFVLFASVISSSSFGFFCSSPLSRAFFFVF
jgi:hypothetical protein